MRVSITAMFALALCVSAVPVTAQNTQPPAPPAADASKGGVPGVKPIQSEKYKTTYIELGNDGEGLLFEPAADGPKERIAMVFSHPNRNTFGEPLGPEMASRGYRVLMVNYRGDADSPEGLPEEYLPSMSKAIAYLRSLPGTERVVLVGHSGGAHLSSLYENVAEHGPSACQGPEKIYPCDGKELDGLEKPDGLILLDPTIGAGHQMSAVDPAVREHGRDRSLDMFSASNGYDRAAKRANYSQSFAKHFYHAQAARNASIVDRALERLHLISKGKGDFANDEPYVIRGIGVRSSGARLYQTDTSFVSHTKKPHLLLRADGTETEEIVTSVRPPMGQNVVDALDDLDVMNDETTIRRFLAGSAIRTTADYAITADDIVGVNWNSAYNSTPANAEGVSVPALVLTMTCHYLVVPGEIIFDRLGSKDKTYAAVEGATHVFKACKPEYGDTVKHTFDFVDAWLAKEGRF